VGTGQGVARIGCAAHGGRQASNSGNNIMI